MSFIPLLCTLTEVFEEVLEIVSYMTFFSPTISLDMWSLWPLMMEALADWAIDFFPSMISTAFFLQFISISFWYHSSFKNLVLEHLLIGLFDIYPKAMSWCSKVNLEMNSAMPKIETIFKSEPDRRQKGSTGVFLLVCIQVIYLVTLQCCIFLSRCAITDTFCVLILVPLFIYLFIYCKNMLTLCHCNAVCFL